MSLLIPMLLFLVSPLGATQKPDSMITIARERGGSEEFTLFVNSPISTVERLVADSTIIVQGTVKSVSTKLSPDQTLVRTAYEVVPVRYYKGSLSVRREPGPPTPLIVVRPGGALDIDGLHLRTTVNSFPENESLNVGDVAILFLQPDSDSPSEFRLTGGPFGAFQLKGGLVSALTRDVAVRRRDGTPTVSEFERRVLAALER